MLRSAYCREHTCLGLRESVVCASNAYGTMEEYGIMAPKTSLRPPESVMPQFTDWSTMRKIRSARRREYVCLVQLNSDIEVRKSVNLLVKLQVEASTSVLIIHVRSANCQRVPQSISRIPHRFDLPNLESSSKRQTPHRGAKKRHKGQSCNRETVHDHVFTAVVGPPSGPT